MMKKLGYTLAIAGALLSFSQVANAAEIKGATRVVTVEQARSFVENPEGRFSATQYIMTNQPYFNNANVTIKDSAGQIVAQTVTGQTNVGGGNFSVPSLTSGTYTVELTSPGHAPVQTLHPSSQNSVNLQTSMTVSVTITDDNQVVSLDWLLAPIPRRILSFTTKGTLAGGTNSNDVNGVPLNYRVWYKGAQQAGVYERNGVRYTYFPGALHGDTLNNYSDVFTVPTLSDAEKAYGWTFKGWRVNGSDQVYTSNELSDDTITSDLQLEAVWEAPKYSVTFATNTDMGAFNGEASVTYPVEGNTSTVANATNNSLPTPTAKDGYEFLGWYTDATTNLVSTDTINSSMVKSNVIYFAKYRKLQPDVTIGANGNWYVNGVDTGKPSRGEKGDTGATGASVTITNSTVDADGNTVITFSDGTTATIFKGKDGTNGENGTNGKDGVNGKDGTNGKDGVNGKDGNSITIVSTLVLPNGSTQVAFSDGTSLTIPKGKDAEALTVTGYSTDKDGNTVLTFSDGATATIAKGKDGADGTAVAIASARYDSAGNAVIDFSDGTSVLVTKPTNGNEEKAPNVSIGKNGTWIVDGKDTGIKTADATTSTPFVKGLLPSTGSLNYISTIILIWVAGVFAFAGYLFGKKRMKN